ncbi:spore coat protein GerQ [Effusibacillus dendaii]|uniref:Spore coat protein GerQ n=1 Tax=Effusibacillus dendaii TaxID=2743772 RepID=A0A7I8DIF5_9BACL|nr:spore coat protein GerQ [Effusibacillus dendaii]BCJ87621.1 hypothetical protein skT53_26060 [Effusibacillus dendaii]
MYYFPYQQPFYPYAGTAQPGAAAAAVPRPSGAPFPVPSQTVPLPMLPDTGVPGTVEESYIENILRFNRGKVGNFYFTFENNPEWNARVIRGRIETAGRDHLILSDPTTGKRYLMLLVNFDYAEFDEPLAYIPPRLPPGVQQELTTGTGAR